MLDKSVSSRSDVNAPGEGALAGTAMRKQEPSDNEEQVYEMQVRICKAFANPTRLRMLDLLSKGEMTVSEIQAQLGVTTANVSQHLSVLKGAGVIATRRQGKQIYCTVSLPEVKQACGLIRNVLRAQIRRGRKLVV